MSNEKQETSNGRYNTLTKKKVSRFIGKHANTWHLGIHVMFLEPHFQDINPTSSSLIKEIKKAGKRRKLYNLLMSNHYSARESTTMFTTCPLYCSRHKNTWTKPTAKTRMVHNLGWVIAKWGTNSCDKDHLKFLGVWWSKDEHIDPNGKDKFMSWLHQVNHTNKPI